MRNHMSQDLDGHWLPCSDETLSNLVARFKLKNAAGRKLIRDFMCRSGAWSSFILVPTRNKLGCFAGHVAPRHSREELLDRSQVLQDIVSLEQLSVLSHVALTHCTASYSDETRVGSDAPVTKFAVIFDTISGWAPGPDAVDGFRGEFNSIVASLCRAHSSILGETPVLCRAFMNIMGKHRHSTGMSVHVDVDAPGGSVVLLVSGALCDKGLCFWDSLDDPTISVRLPGNSKPGNSIAFNAFTPHGVCSKKRRIRRISLNLFFI